MKIERRPRRYFSGCGFGKGTPLQAAEKVGQPIDFRVAQRFSAAITVLF
jgi:hypothetical protein